MKHPTSEMRSGADPDEKDVYGDIPLIYASRGGHIYVAALLLEWGADSRVQDNTEVMGETGTHMTAFLVSRLRQ